MCERDAEITTHRQLQQNIFSVFVNGKKCPREDLNKPCQPHMEVTMALGNKI